MWNFKLIAYPYRVKKGCFGTRSARYVNLKEIERRDDRGKEDFGVKKQGHSEFQWEMN